MERQAYLSVSRRLSKQRKAHSVALRSASNPSSPEWSTVGDHTERQSLQRLALHQAALFTAAGTATDVAHKTICRTGGSNPRSHHTYVEVTRSTAAQVRPQRAEGCRGTKRQIAQQVGAKFTAMGAGILQKGGHSMGADILQKGGHSIGAGILQKGGHSMGAGILQKGGHSMGAGILQKGGHLNVTR